MDFSNIVSQYESKQIRKLSIKENSAVYAVKNEDGGIFVLRIYDRPMPGYQALAGQGRRGAAGDISGMPKVYSCRTEQGCFVVE
ncbi:MAG: hypothetical protein ACI4Q5_05870, partial [Porcipelethomonas sp.]